MHNILKYFDYIRQKGVLDADSEKPQVERLFSAAEQGCTSTGRTFRFSRIDFPKFNGDDVVGWIYRCNHFFKVESVLENVKLDLVTIHVEGDALLCHQFFMQMKELQGSMVTWEEYNTDVHGRSGDGLFDDPILELKNLKQTGTAITYYQEFTSLFHRVQLADPLTERQVLSLFRGCLHPELQGPVRMIQPKTLYDAFSLANLQEATLHIRQDHHHPPFCPRPPPPLPPSKPAASLEYLPTPSRATKPRNNYILSPAELADKRANELCFGYDEKYVSGHTCKKTRSI